MKATSLLTLLLLGFVASGPVPIPRVDTTVRGDYVEARTASVFCGACHYNGELVTSGRDAILAWSIASGSYHGVDLAGVHAMAAIVSDQNLGDPLARRKCELAVDINASNAQATALADWVRSCDGSELGQIVHTSRSSISFRHEDGKYQVSCDAIGSMSVQPMPNNECCTQPHLVWYKPLMTIEHRKVGYTQTASCSASISDPWDRSEENSAFYGEFAFAGR